MYLGVARKFGCPLVTLDEGLLAYGSLGFHEIVHPNAWT
jgi:predicted nucleic acid-binding protein